VTGSSRALRGSGCAAAALGALACAGLGDEPDRFGPLEYPPGDPAPPSLDCALGAGDPGCAPPQVLIVLDRSTSMVARPDGTVPPDTATALEESKWRRAIDAIEAVVSSDAAAGVAFGLEIFPRDPGEGGCATVEAVLERSPRLTAACRQGSLLVPPCIGANAAVASALDVETDTLCGDTPIAGALEVARDTLAAMRNPAQEQFVLLVTDGGETCDQQVSAPEVAGELSRASVATFAVGFGGYGVDPVVLSDLACAGGTALDAETACVLDDAGDARWDPAAPFPFLLAEDGPTLEAVIAEIATQVGCVVIR